MASNITKGPMFRAIVTRGYAQLSPVSGSTSYDVQVNSLPNKLVVVSAENDSPLARVSIVFRAGSRYETPESLGAAHVLRVAAGLSTKNASQFAITRNIQQVGASLTATVDRENVSYTLEGTRQAVEQSLHFLTEVATQQVFKPWELPELGDRLKLDLAVRPLQLRAVDLLHKAAFRRGLGNSLFIPKFKIGKINSETLQHYVASNFTFGRGAVVGVGFESKKVTQLAQSLSLNDGDGVTNPSPFKGGEVRSDKGGDFAYVAIAGEGPPLKEIKGACVTAVLVKVLGAGPQVKWSLNDNGIVSKAIAGQSNEAFGLTGIKASYYDVGLVGLLLEAPARSAGKLVEGALKVFKSGSASDADVARGKALLKTSLLHDLESGGNALQLLRKQAILTGTAYSPRQLLEIIESITTADVNNALRKAGSKLAIASVGNLSNVPYIDELK